MGKISNYVQDADVKLNDKLLGSDESGTTNNYTITSISKIFKEANAAGVGGQFTYKLDAGAGQARTVAWDSGEMVVQTRNCAFGLVFVGVYDIEGSTSQQTIPASLRGWWLMEL